MGASENWRSNPPNGLFISQERATPPENIHDKDSGPQPKQLGDGPGPASSPRQHMEIGHFTLLSRFSHPYSAGKTSHDLGSSEHGLRLKCMVITTFPSVRRRSCNRSDTIYIYIFALNITMFISVTSSPGSPSLQDDHGRLGHTTWDRRPRLFNWVPF